MKFSLSFTEDQLKKLLEGEPAVAARIPFPEKRLAIEFDANELYFMDKVDSDKVPGNDYRVRLRHKPIRRPEHVVHARKKTPKK